MKLVFAHEASEGKPVSDSDGHQKVAAAILDGKDLYVLLMDFLSMSYYIERVKNRFDPDPYRSDNFETISDDEFVTYHRFLHENKIIPKSGV